jgi:hypothetical protein
MVQVKEGDYERRTLFVSGFYEQYMMAFFTQNLHFSLIKLGSIRQYSNVQSNRYWSSVNMRQTLKCPFTITKMICGVPLHLYK